MTVPSPIPSPDLHAYDAVLINTSAGKDSQTAMRAVIQQADRQSYSRKNITAFHADLGRMEWKGVRDLAETQAKHYGLRFVVGKYNNKEKEELTLLDYVRKRGKWPSSTTRFCTSDFKRGPGRRVLTRMHRELVTAGRGVVYNTRILNVFGFRAEESITRKKKVKLAVNTAASTKKLDDHGTRKRTVWDWLPIHDWEEQRVWDDIIESGVPYHPAYDLGMPRLSCCFCIFAPDAALMIAGKANPGLLDEYVQLEEEIGHDFQNKKPIRRIKDRLDVGEEPDVDQLDGEWNM